jgi:beta-glucosidase
MVSILDGIKEFASPSTIVQFASGCEHNSNDEIGFSEALKIARESDVVIFVLGDLSGLAFYCTTGEFRDRTDLRLPGLQEKLFQHVLQANKPIVLVLNNGRPASIPELIEKSNAVLEAWIPGEEGGNAVAQVLFGDVNPGGKLPLSIPRSVGQLPVFYNHKPSGRHSNIYKNYVNEEVTPLFAFGHGLSYTTFEFSNLKISSIKGGSGNVVDISLKVKNTGKRAGDEVVQLYIRDEYASYPRPVKELKGFIRLQLSEGETKTVIFHLPTDQLAFYDHDLKLILEPGKFLVMVGNSSDDIKLEGEFVIGGDIIEIRERVFVCPVEIQ